MWHLSFSVYIFTRFFRVSNATLFNDILYCTRTAVTVQRTVVNTSVRAIVLSENVNERRDGYRVPNVWNLIFRHRSRPALSIVACGLLVKKRIGFLFFGFTPENRCSKTHSPPPQVIGPGFWFFPYRFNFPAFCPRRLVRTLRTLAIFKYGITRCFRALCRTRRVSIAHNSRPTVYRFMRPAVPRLKADARKRRETTHIRAANVFRDKSFAAQCGFGQSPSVVPITGCSTLEII